MSVLSPKNNGDDRAITYRRKLIKFAEIWFDDKTPAPPADIVQYISAKQAPSDNIDYEEFYTPLIALLDRSDDELLKAMDSNTRYEIRRSETRDALQYSSCIPRDISDLGGFMACYEKNVASNESSPKLDIRRMSALVDAGMLDVSAMRTSDGQPLTWHVHILAKNIARLFLSASIFSTAGSQDLRNLCGRANRLHHWKDIRRYREQRLSDYDFGGYYMGDEDQKKIQINKFKSGFGGTVTCTYNYLVPTTLCGKVALGIRRMRSG